MYNFQYCWFVLGNINFTVAWKKFSWSSSGVSVCSSDDDWLDDNDDIDWLDNDVDWLNNDVDWVDNDIYWLDSDVDVKDSDDDRVDSYVD